MRKVKCLLLAGLVLTGAGCGSNQPAAPLTEEQNRRIAEEDRQIADEESQGTYSKSLKKTARAKPAGKP